MTKFKYGDKVIVTKDESDGFFIGAEGIIKNYSKDKDEVITYHLELSKEALPFSFKEEDLQKI